MLYMASQVMLVVKNLPASVGEVRGTGSIPGSGSSPGEGNGYPLQYYYPENPMDRGAWWATVHGVTKSWTQLRDFHMFYGKWVIESIKTVKTFKLLFCKKSC